jgi:hypothetical protein
MKLVSYGLFDSRQQALTGLIDVLIMTLNFNIKSIRAGLLGLKPRLRTMLKLTALLFIAVIVIFVNPSYAQKSSVFVEATEVASQVLLKPSWLADVSNCPSKLMPRQQVLDYASNINCKATQFESCLSKCSNSEPGACYWLAYGLHLQKVDPKASEILYQRACKLGLTSGCTNRAAGMLSEAPEDITVQTCAADTFSKACAFDDPWACTMYASHLTSGKGTQPNKELALKVLSKSCKFGIEDEACKNGMRLKKAILATSSNAVHDK